MKIKIWKFYTCSTLFGWFYLWNQPTLNRKVSAQ